MVASHTALTSYFWACRQRQIKLRIMAVFTLNSLFVFKLPANLRYFFHFSNKNINFASLIETKTKK